jgi:hypothetical protein
VTLGFQGSVRFRRQRASVEKTILEEIDEIASSDDDSGNELGEDETDETPLDEDN